MVLALAAVAAASGCAAPPGERRSSTPGHGSAAPTALTPTEHAANLASFDEIWNTVRERHWDATLGGVDWEAARAELRPRVVAATDAEAARAVMRDLLGRLRQSHFNIIPASVYAAVSHSPSEAGDGVTGIRIAVIDGVAVVRAVDPGSSASEAGIGPGWVIERINGTAVADLLAPIQETYAASSLREARLVGAVESRLEGPTGTHLPVELRNAADRPVTCELTLRTPPGKRVGLGHLPPQHVRLERRTLAGGVAYVSLNYFLDPAGVLPALDAVADELAAAPGVVLDLRGNPGGIAGMGTGLAGLFLAERNRALGTMRTRDATLKLTVNPRARTVSSPLAVLIDATSASTSEFVAGGLQDLGRARVFGARSAGAALPSVITRLPNGDGFQYAVASYTSAGGAPLEGVGVTPDETVVLTRAALLAGADPVLDAALRWIATESADRMAVDSTPATGRTQPDRAWANDLEKDQ
jgi:carboxyl-terminal processing protease